MSTTAARRQRGNYRRLREGALLNSMINTYTYHEIFHKLMYRNGCLFGYDKADLILLQRGGSWGRERRIPEQRSIDGYALRFGGLRSFVQIYVL
jgi:hypothetical protein